MDYLIRLSTPALRIHLCDFVAEVGETELAARSLSFKMILTLWVIYPSLLRLDALTVHGNAWGCPILGLFRGQCCFACSKAS